MGIYGSPDLSNFENSNNKNTNMIYCQYCGRRYSKYDKRCPVCKKRRAQPFYNKWWFWTLAVLVFFAVYPGNGNLRVPTNEILNNADNQGIISEEDYKASCVQMPPYAELSRNPNTYINQNITCTGQVIQVQEDGNTITLRVNVNKNEYGTWEDTCYVEYVKKTENESRILENDIITLYGEFKGIKNYTAVLGNQISVPLIKANYIFIDTSSK